MLPLLLCGISLAVAPRARAQDAMEIVQLAMAKAEAGKLDWAEQDCGRAIEADPKCLAAYSLRMELRFHRANHAGALEDCSKIIEIEPLNAEAYSVRGQIRQKAGLNKEALADLNKSIELYPNEASVYQIRGVLRMDDPDGAIADFNQAIRLNPKDIESYLHRGQMRLKKDCPTVAVEDFNHVIESNTDKWEAYYGRAVAKTQLGKPEEALEDFERTTKLKPDHAAAFSYMAGLHRRRHAWANALGNYRKAAALDPEHDPATFGIWLCLVRNSEAKTADSELDRYIETRVHTIGDTWPIHIAEFLRGKLPERKFFELGRDSDATKQQEHACQAWYYAGLKRQIAGDKTTAILYFQRCLATGVKKFEEFNFAQDELKDLGVTPPTP